MRTGCGEHRKSLELGRCLLLGCLQWQMGGRLGPDFYSKQVADHTVEERGWCPKVNNLSWGGRASLGPRKSSQTTFLNESWPQGQGRVRCYH